MFLRVLFHGLHLVCLCLRSSVHVEEVDVDIGTELQSRPSDDDKPKVRVMLRDDGDDDER